MDDSAGDRTTPQPPVEASDGAPPAQSIPPADSRSVYPAPTEPVVPSTAPARSPTGPRWDTTPGSAGAGLYPSTPAPTSGWPRPPFSDAPPRPVSAPPYRYQDLTGPPLPAEIAGPALPPRRRRLLRAVGGAVIALSLLSGGFALGTVLSEDSESVTPTNTLRPALDTDTDSISGSGGSSNSSVLPPDAPGPLADEDFDEPVAAVAAAVNPSVVRILTSFGQGSGIVWDAANGYIVTNNHVVGDESAVSIRFADGTQADGEVVGGSSATDVAVVKVDPSELLLVEAVFAPTSTVEVGQLAVAIGSPFMLDQTVTAGIVSAIRINLSGGSDPFSQVPVEMIQTDAPINPGNSGGALADRQGRVIGMNTSIRTDGVSDGNVGVGFAVPSDTIVLIAHRIVNGESLDLGYLGVSGAPEADNNGVLVTEVVPGSPAELAGLSVGDLIVGLDGSDMSEISELSAAIKLYRPGDLVELEIVRGETNLIAEVELGSLSDAN